MPIGEAHQLVARLRELGRPVTYLELPGEGHVFHRRVDSRKRLAAAMVRFLAQSLPV